MSAKKYSVLGYWCEDYYVDLQYVMTPYDIGWKIKYFNMIEKWEMKEKILNFIKIGWRV